MGNKTDAKLPKDFIDRLQYSASLACLAICKEEGIIVNETEYMMLRNKIQDKYRKKGLKI